ncbi:MAG TPA: hypothetical protein VKJ07_14185, partial [Mycobacteriales bacterium]|nr:hypothetical protein [Mycobacteriales bacterium]
DSFNNCGCNTGDSYARSSGLFGDVNANAHNNTSLSSLVSTAAGALITAGPRIATSSLTQLGALDHLALYVDTTNGPISTHTHAHASKRSLAAGGDNGNSDNGVGAGPHVQFDANVLILPGPNPELVVGATGLIQKAVNVSVWDQAAGVTRHQGDTITDSVIRVDDISNHDPGQVYMEAKPTNAGYAAPITLDGGPGDGSNVWEFRDTYAQVLITNFSTKTLQVDNIDVVNRTVQPRVSLNTDNEAHLPLTFGLKRSVAPTLVDIDNESTSDIVIGGTITNPIGTTEINNTGGSVRSLGARGVGVSVTLSNGTNSHVSDVVTNILDVNAPGGTVGLSSPRVNVDIVDANGVPQATTFRSARVATDTGAIYLGRHQFFTGEQVRYSVVSGTALGNLTPNGIYYVIASADGLSIELADKSQVTGLLTVHTITSIGAIGDVQSLMPVSRFTVDAATDIYLDLKDHARNSNVEPHSVEIDLLTAGNDINLLLQPTVDETTPSSILSTGVCVTTPGTATCPGTPATPPDYYKKFRPDTQSQGGALDSGVFETAPGTSIASTYVIKSKDQTTGLLTLPGAIAGGNIIVNAAQPNNSSPHAFVNVDGIENVAATGIAGTPSNGHIFTLTNGFISWVETIGDLRVDTITSTQSDVTLLAEDPNGAYIYDVVTASDDHVARVVGNNITLLAPFGGIGYAPPPAFPAINYLEIESSHSADGGLTADALYSIWVEQTAKKLLVKDVTSSAGDAALITDSGAILDADNAATADVTARNVDLIAHGGGIGVLSADA